MSLYKDKVCKARIVNFLKFLLVIMFGKANIYTIKILCKYKFVYAKCTHSTNLLAMYFLICV